MDTKPSFSKKDLQWIENHRKEIDNKDFDFLVREMKSSATDFVTLQKVYMMMALELGLKIKVICNLKSYTCWSWVEGQTGKFEQLLGPSGPEEIKDNVYKFFKSNGMNENLLKRFRDSLEVVIL